MAEMEKITYLPLIKHLKEAGGFYNELLKNHELQQGTINTDQLTEWMLHVVEPVLKNIEDQKLGHLPRLCRLLFSRGLSNQSKQSSFAYSQETKAAFLMCKEMPDCFVESPVRILNAIESALRSIREYQRERVGEWISSMSECIAHCEKVDDFLNCGRVCAWLSGLAHLKTRVKKSFESLPLDVQSAIKKNTAHPDFEKLFDKNWNHQTSLTFVTTMGDFVGFGGAFEQPPVIAKIEDQVFATDGKSTLALFADQFGQVLVEQSNVEPNHILSTLESRIDKPKGIYFDDIRSIARLKDTLFLTRASSHCVFVYVN